MKLTKLSKAYKYYENQDTDKVYSGKKFGALFKLEQLVSLDTLNPANRLCIYLSNELSAITGESYFYLLMPTLNKATLPSDDKLINRFTISNDNAYLIETIHTLYCYAAYGDFIDQFENNCSGLNTDEINRVIFHTSQTQSSYTRIKEMCESTSSASLADKIQELKNIDPMKASHFYLLQITAKKF